MKCTKQHNTHVHATTSADAPSPGQNHNPEITTVLHVDHHMRYRYQMLDMAHQHHAR
jgi:hypothetical protein